MHRARVVTLIVAALLSACTRPASPGAVPTGDIDPAAYPACAKQPSPAALPDVPGLALPDEATVFSVHEVGPLTQAEGIVSMTPIQMRRYYEQRDDLRKIAVEDERVEAEILVSDGEHRMFVKVQVVCAGGSNFTATVGSEANSAGVPTPAGTPAPSS